MGGSALKKLSAGYTSSDSTVLTQIRMPNGRIVERVNKDTIARALQAAGKKSAAASTKESKQKG